MTKSIKRILSISVFLAAPAALAQTEAPAAPAAEAPAAAEAAPAPTAVAPPQESAAPSPLPAPALVTATAIPPAPSSGALAIMSKFSATFYGFAEADFVHDSTQSFNDLAGNATIAKSGTYAANNDRMTFGVRNSRLGFKLKGPESETIRSSAIAEMDFLGNQPQSGPLPTGSPAVSESSYFASPTFRIRHMALKLETPFIDVLAGQYWELFGWQSLYHPNSVQIQGLPGQVFSRAPQLRLSHMFKSDVLNVEVAIAAVRPPQRDSGLPDGQAGVRVILNDWKGMRTAGGAGTSVDSLSVGVSGVARRFRLPNWASSPTQTQTIDGYGLSFDGIIPVVPATAQNWDNALTLTGSFVQGQAIADLYTGLTGGTSLTPLPLDGTGKASSFNMDIDNGLVVFDANGQMHAIRWQSFMVGAQYYLPTSPFRMWVSANYTQMNSSDIGNIVVTTPGVNTNGKLFNKSQFLDGNLFVDATQSIRFGLEYAWSKQNYLDGGTGTNNRVQLSGFYIF